MPVLGYTKSRVTGKDNIPRENAAENFRQILLRLHRLWDPDFEIVFWRRRGRVFCEIQDSCSSIDKRRTLRMRRRALKMRHSPLKIMRTKRLALNLTLAQAAKKAGLSRSHWNMIEIGRKPMKLETLYKISEALDLEPHRLLRSPKDVTQIVARRRHCSLKPTRQSLQEISKLRKEMENSLAGQ